MHENCTIYGEFGPNTEDAVIQFQLDRGFSSSNVDGIVGEGTHKELLETSDVYKNFYQKQIKKS